MKRIILLLLTFVIGDCVQITRGVFKGQYWRVIAVNEDSTFDLKDLDWTLRGVRGSYLIPAKSDQCREPS